MIISGYLYHSQSTIPEGWIKKLDYQFCSIENQDLSRHSKMLGERHGNTTKVQQWIDNIQQDCRETRKLFGKKNITYHDILEDAKRLGLSTQKTKDSSITLLADGSSPSIDLYPAIRVETLRTIVERVNGGDILNMAVNCLNDQAEHVRRTTLAEFPAGDAAKFKASAKVLFEFLYNGTDDSTMSDDCHICQCAEKGLNYSVNLLFNNDFVSPAKLENLNAHPGQKTHVTSNVLTSAEKNAYKKRLANDPVFGEFLQFATLVVDR
jgi:hypothetical protein